MKAPERSVVAKLTRPPDDPPTPSRTFAFGTARLSSSNTRPEIREPAAGGGSRSSISSRSAVPVPEPGSTAAVDTGLPLTEAVILASAGPYRPQPPRLAAPHEAETADSQEAGPPSRDAHVGFSSS